MAVAKAGDVRGMEMAPGEDWLPDLAGRLHDVHAVLALDSRSYLNSDMCWFEGLTALGMNKLIPIKIDPALAYGEMPEPFRKANVPALDLAALADNDAGKAHLGSPEAVRAFMALVEELKVASASRRPFDAWEEAEVHRVGETALALQKAFRWPFQRKSLNWSQGKLGAQQRFRFHAALSDLCNCAGNSRWDAARRRALRALHDAPGKASVRAAVVLGLIGELSPAEARCPDGANRNPEPWRRLGDLALPFDRKVSRFAYARAGDIPNDVRETFQVMQQRSAGRATVGWAGLGVGAVIGTSLGVILASGLGGPPPAVRLTPAAGGARVAPAAPNPSTAAPARLAPATSPAPAPPAIVARPLAPSPASLRFSVAAKGLEYSVKEKLRATPNEFSWQEVYAATIAVNLEALCSAQRRVRAERGSDPLNAIGSAEIFAWPSLDEVRAHRADPRACPVPAVITSLPD